MRASKFNPMVTLLLVSIFCAPGIPQDASMEILPDLRKSVFNLLRNPDIGQDLDEKVRISFFVTSDQEVVVLKTDARTVELDKFIKKRLNYHKIKADHSDTNRIYHLMVYFKLKEIEPLAER